jgi:CubicO group peptidase (beta-lactamase class C family)
MRYCSLALFAPLGAALGQQPSCRAHVDSLSNAVDSAIVKSMAEYSVPGAALAVVRDGKIVQLRGYGCANVEKNVAVDPERTVFHVASVSKPFVSLAVVQLAAKGSVDVHADVNRYLRTMQVPNGWGRPITLHDLLTHTAGLEESVVGYAARTPADIRPLGEFLAAKLPKRGWPPGDVTGYSNYGYALAGYVVEQVTGKSFVDYERDAILSPLGMTRSSFTQPIPSELERDAAISYRCLTASCVPIPPDYRSAYPPGGLVTTASDMSRFLLAQLGDSVNGTRVLSDSLLRLMDERAFTHDSSLAGLTYGYSEDNLLGVRSLSHAGGASGYTSFVVLVPTQRFGVFLVANGGGTRFGAETLDAVAKAWMPAPALVAQNVSVSGISPVDPAGAYRLTRYAHRGLENLPMLFNGQLHVARVSRDTIAIIGLGDANGRYVAVANNRWQRVGGSERVAVRVANGKVTHFFGPQSFFGTRFPGAFEKLAWYDEPGFLNEALSYVIAIPMIALLAWPIVAAIVWLVRRRTRLVTRIRQPLGGNWRGLAVAAAVAFTALGLWFGFGLIAASNRAAERGGGELVYGLPTAMRVLSYAPGVIAVITIVMVVATVLAWRRRWWSLPGLVMFSVITLNAIAFVAILVRWGYFPVATG